MDIDSPPQQPNKRKRSSILRLPEKRYSRDSRTVSFSEKFMYKELHQDGTCEITKFFMNEDMDVVEPVIADQTIEGSIDMSIDQTRFTQDIDVTLVTQENNISICEKDMIEPSRTQATDDSSEDMDETLKEHETTLKATERDSSPSNEAKSGPHSTVSSLSTLDERDMIECSFSKFQASTRTTSNSTLTNVSSTPNATASGQVAEMATMPAPTGPQATSTREEQHSMETTFKGQSRLTSLGGESSISISDLSYGAFHDSNNFSMRSSGGLDTFMNHIEALDECIQKVDQEVDDRRRRLDLEIEELFKFYRHIVNRDNKYEFAVAIIGLRHSLWLIIKINPETYPNEKLQLTFAVNKKDRHLYPFADYSEAVRRCTKEGYYGYLTKIIINAQRFRRFLRKTRHRRTE